PLATGRYCQVTVVVVRHHAKSTGNDRFRPSLVDFERSQPREGERRRGAVSAEEGRKKKRRRNVSAHEENELGDRYTLCVSFGTRYRTIPSKARYASTDQFTILHLVQLNFLLTLSCRGARASVWENFKNNPLFDISTDHPTTYYEDMQRAVFCLCPLGWAPWSPRLVEAVVFGCIPVVIADDIVLPFADAIPWEEIGVFVAEEDVPQLDTILTSIPIEVVLRKQRLLANPSMKQAMLFPQPAQPGDAFHQILNGLARKLPHDDGVYLKPGQKTLNWTAGPVGDLKPW
ncbi:hypothetical protein BHE74_00050879, partial [Ensete ventricosum]